MENCHAVPSSLANDGFDRRESREEFMSGQTVKIRSSEGGEFDCYLVAPKAGAPKSDATMPAIVLASAVHGVDADIRAIADEFAANGVIAAAPDLFWRTLPGPLSHDDTRTQQRSQPRLEKIKTGERDLVDMLAYLRTLAQFNGQAAVMGFCYGGPYAILGPKRLGYAAGISCHGTQFLDYSTACASRSASSGATATAGRRPRCSTPIAISRRA
jgi:carboxymethylenebutenolidase